MDKSNNNNELNSLNSKRKSEYKSEYKSGLISLLGCMLLWGILPVYWKALVPINSWVIILYRVFLVFVFAILIARRYYSFKEIFDPIKNDKRLLPKSFAAGALITANWSTYIWAVNAGYVIQSSIGYYIEPLVVCALAILIFKERITGFKIVAFGLALLAIVIQLVHFRAFPGIALGLASSFAIYAAIKKGMDQPPLISLVYETMFFAPFALIGVVIVEMKGIGAFSVASPMQIIMLMFAGLLTVIPLALFASAAKKVPLITLGLMEYISPTMGMILGVFVYHEPFDLVMFISLVIIWIGLVFFTISEIKENR